MWDENSLRPAWPESWMMDSSTWSWWVNSGWRRWTGYALIFRSIVETSNWTFGKWSSPDDEASWLGDRFRDNVNFARNIAMVHFFSIFICYSWWTVLDHINFHTMGVKESPKHNIISLQPSSALGVWIATSYFSFLRYSNIPLLSCSAWGPTTEKGKVVWIENNMRMRKWN